MYGGCGDAEVCEEGDVSGYGSELWYVALERCEESLGGVGLGSCGLVEEAVDFRPVDVGFCLRLAAALSDELFAAPRLEVWGQPVLVGDVFELDEDGFVEGGGGGEYVVLAVGGDDGEQCVG